MIRFSRTAQLSALALFVTLGACTTKQEAAVAPPPPPPPAQAAPAPAPVTSSIIPGSAEDFRVNVGDTVHFAYNEYSVQSADQATLQKQAAWLARYPQVRVTVAGYTDGIGTAQYNQGLSERRAKIVYDYLTAHGIAASRLDGPIGHGKNDPIDTNDTEAGRARNRRTELQVEQ